MPADNK
jgi:hypothetical protein